MKPVSFENGELLSKKGKPVELEKGQRLVVIEGSELGTAITGLEFAARIDRERVASPTGTRSSSRGLLRFAEKFEEIADGFKKVKSFKPHKS